MTDLDWNNVEKRTNELALLFLKTSEKLKERNPNYSKIDARLTIFVKCHHVMNSIHLSAVFMRECGIKKEWWSKLTDISKNQTVIDETLLEHNKTLRFSLAMFLPSMIESSLRDFVRKMDPSACNNGRGDFKNIYSWLMPRLTLNDNQYEELLDLIRIYRNGPHTNWIYLPRTPGNKIITYKDEQFLFEDGKKIKSRTWDFYLDKIQDLHDMILEMVETEEISNFDNIPTAGY